MVFLPLVGALSYSIHAATDRKMRKAGYVICGTVIELLVRKKTWLEITKIGSRREITASDMARWLILWRNEDDMLELVSNCARWSMGNKLALQKRTRERELAKKCMEFQGESCITQ